MSKRASWRKWAIPSRVAYADGPSATATLEKTIEATFGEIKSLVTKQDEEIAKNGEVTAQTAKALSDATARWDEQHAEHKARMDAIEATQNRIGDGTGSEGNKTLGELFAESDAYKSFAQKGFSGTSDSMPVTRKQLSAGTEIATGLDAYLWQPNRLPGIIAPNMRPERVRDLLPVIPTTSNMIEFVRETGFTNNAATVGEFDADDEDEKPRSDLEFTLEQTGMKTIAHWAAATRQIMADVPAMVAYVNTRLLNGIDLVEDAQILYGDGLGTNMLGIANHPDIQTYDGGGATVPATDTKIDAIRRSMTLTRLAEYRASGVVVNPIDWEDIELAKGNDDHYIWVTVGEGGQQRVWRVPVIDTTAIDDGTFLTGAFNLAAAIWDREQANIRVSDQHDKFFTKNLLAILAEERLTLTVYRPEAFVLGTFG